MSKDNYWPPVSRAEFSDLRAEVMILHRSLKKHLQNSEVAALQDIGAAAKDIAKAIRENKTNEITPEMLATIEEIIARTKANAAELEAAK